MLKIVKKNIFFYFIPIFISVILCSCSEKTSEKISYDYNETTETLSYTVSDKYASDIPVNAHVYFPTETPKGVILYWNGTFLPNTVLGRNQTSPSVLYTKNANLFNEYVLVQPFMIGAGDSFQQHHQRWMMLDSVKEEGNTILKLIKQLLLEKYSLDIKAMPLFQIGGSLGAIYTTAYHAEFQRSTDVNQYFDLKNSYAAAGIYSADILKDSLLSTFEDYKENVNIQTSIDEERRSLSKAIQNVVLAHTLFTYHNFNGALNNINYINGIDLDSPSGVDDFSFMDILYSNLLSNFSASMNPVLIPEIVKTPYFLTDESWDSLKTPGSAAYQDLTAFFNEHTVLDRYHNLLEKNKKPITLICHKNDLNVIMLHSKRFISQGYPHVTDACETNTSASKIEVNTLLFWHDKSWEKAKELLAEQLNDSN